jgi:septal ring factor EnvC (AmiA/AmiB activator)
VAHLRVQVRTQCVGALLALTLSLAQGLPQAIALSDRDRADSELKSIVAELNQLDQWIDDAERRHAGLQKDLANHDHRVADNSRALAAADKALVASEASIDKLRLERRELERQRDAQATRIASHVNAAYRLQRQDVFRAFLNNEVPADIDRMLRYHRYFSDARMQTMRAFQATLTALDGNQQNLEVEQQALVMRREELHANQTTLESSRSERSTLIQTLAKDMADKLARQKQLTADRKRLEKLLTELSRRVREQSSTEFARRKGGLPTPVSGNTVYRYGAPRADGRLRWEGMVYRSNRGAPVYAVHRGTVVFANWLRGFGMLTIIDHGNGFLTLYGYVDDLLKTEGDVVESGEVIAHAGQSGGQVFDGVYFEIRHRGVAIDPRPWLKK